MTEQRLCIVCRRAKLEPTERQTCVLCLGAARRALLDVQDMYALLPDELTERAGAASPPEPNGNIAGSDSPMPGGTVMVLLAPGSDGANQAREIAASDTPDTAAPHARDENPGDPPSVLGELERWDRDWRHQFGDPAPDTPATVAECVGYLDRRLARAAQHHPVFDEFAADMGALRYVLAAVLRRNPQRTVVPCLTCETRSLERPEPREDGRRFEWQCSRCHRNYTQEEFWMAVRQHGEAI